MEPHLECKWAGCALGPFRDADELYSHLTNDHVGRKAKKNLCLDCKWLNCSVKTSKRDHITSHLRVHIPLKPHSCKECGKSFKRPQDLKKHEKKHPQLKFESQNLPFPNYASNYAQKSILKPNYSSFINYTIPSFSKTNPTSNAQPHVNSLYENRVFVPLNTSDNQFASSVPSENLDASSQPKLFSRTQTVPTNNFGLGLVPSQSMASPHERFKRAQTLNEKMYSTRKSQLLEDSDSSFSRSQIKSQVSEVTKFVNDFSIDDTKHSQAKDSASRFYNFNSNSSNEYRHKYQQTSPKEIGSYNFHRRRSHPYQSEHLSRFEISQQTPSSYREPHSANPYSRPSEDAPISLDDTDMSSVNRRSPYSQDSDSFKKFKSSKESSDQCSSESLNIYPSGVPGSKKISVSPGLKAGKRKSHRKHPMFSPTIENIVSPTYPSDTQNYNQKNERCLPRHPQQRMFRSLTDDDRLKNVATSPPNKLDGVNCRNENAQAFEVLVSPQPHVSRHSPYEINSQVNASNLTNLRSTKNGHVSKHSPKSMSNRSNSPLNSGSSLSSSTKVYTSQKITGFPSHTQEDRSEINLGSDGPSDADMKSSPNLAPLRIYSPRPTTTGSFPDSELNMQPNQKFPALNIEHSESEKVVLPPISLLTEYVDSSLSQRRPKPFQKAHTFSYF
ncbi:hypothetical protein BB560_004265 [Smittium megazygosporum]|uniref:C2H2-type domain-containing protein n=1 Tax=Smittium megazygosporum TaxID=133381 RepID=A0A2T9Z9Q7_9FUNG|nr:hypothetical protein BB560_004265 [Smittium megazygosporum]